MVDPEVLPLEFEEAVDDPEQARMTPQNKQGVLPTWLFILLMALLIFVVGVGFALVINSIGS